MCGVDRARDRVSPGEPGLGRSLGDNFAVDRDKGIDPGAHLFRDTLWRPLASGRRRSVESTKCALAGGTVTFFMSATKA